jgi:hypothetical protein
MCLKLQDSVFVGTVILEIKDRIIRMFVLCFEFEVLVFP